MMTASAAVEWVTTLDYSRVFKLFIVRPFFFSTYSFSTSSRENQAGRNHVERDVIHEVDISKLGNTEAYGGFYKGASHATRSKINTPLRIFPSRSSANLPSVVLQVFFAHSLVWNRCMTESIFILKYSSSYIINQQMHIYKHLLTT
jgi:hypothetical protein